MQPEWRYAALHFPAPLTCLWRFDLEIALLVTHDVGNLYSKYKHCMVFCFYRVARTMPWQDVCQRHNSTQLNCLSVRPFVRLSHAGIVTKIMLQTTTSSKCQCAAK